MSALQRTRTGRQVCRCLEEETECDQDLSRALIARCFRRECSGLCGGIQRSWPGFESHRRRFESWASSFTPRCVSLSGTLLVYPKRMTVGVKSRRLFFWKLYEFADIISDRPRPDLLEPDFVALFGHVMSFGNLSNKNFLTYSINVYFFMFIIC